AAVGLPSGVASTRGTCAPVSWAGLWGALGALGGALARRRPIRRVQATFDARPGGTVGAEAAAGAEGTAGAEAAAGAERTYARRRSRRRSERISRAAFWPGAPVMPPPGCAPEPQRYRRSRPSR